MRIQSFLSLALVLTSVLCAGNARAVPMRAVGQDEMRMAIATRVGDQTSQRAAIQSLLNRPEVRDLAANSGLDLARAKAAAASLDGAELERLSAQATAVQAQLAGGGTTVYLTTGTLILILIIVILLVQ